jgi:hypothetical protein
MIRFHAGPCGRHAAADDRPAGAEEHASPC